MAGMAKRKEAAQVIQARLDDVLAELGAGKSLRNACIAVGVASESGLLWLMKQDSTVADRVADARKSGAHAIASQVMDIADDVAEFALADPVRVAEMRIKARQWTAGKLDREAYGETKGAQVTVNIAGLHLEALRRQPAPALQQDVIEGEVVELPRLSTDKLEDIL